MENNVLIFVNTALVIGCAVMAIVFLVLPIPSKKGLNKYRISLRILAGAYLTLAILNGLLMVLNVETVNLISMPVLTISSLQATLFASSLITLLNPSHITRSYLYLQLIPVLILTCIYALVAYKYGDPNINNFEKLIQFASNPALIIRETLLLFYIFQLIYLTRSFRRQVRKYEKQIDNYFADSYQLQLPWIKYFFYLALSIGICAIISCFVFSIYMVLGFTIICTFFYIFFGIYYIQYPNTYVFIEPLIYSYTEQIEEITKIPKRIDWSEMKQQIITNNYYLKPGVNIEEMASYLKIGRTTLSLLINTKEDMNFNTWINSLRVEKAKSLLIAYPEYNLTQIAEQIGYSESSNFSRQFKLITTESPSTWRQTRLS